MLVFVTTLDMSSDPEREIGRLITKVMVMI